MDVISRVVADRVSLSLFSALSFITTEVFPIVKILASEVPSICSDDVSCGSSLAMTRGLVEVVKSIFHVLDSV